MNERKLTKSELAKREDIIMKMKKNKRSLVQKYGKDAEAVMYGRATKLAKKQAEAMDQDRIKEMVKAALMNPVKEDQVEEGNAFIVAADAARDAGKKEFEFPKGSGKMHPVTVKADIDEIDLDLKGGTEKDKDADIAGVVGAEDVLGLEEGASTEEKRIAMRAIKSIAKYRGVSNDEARNDLVRAAKEIGDLKEDLDLGHQDNEPHMLKADLYRIGKYAMELYQMVDGFEGQGEVDFPHWWQSKVIKAKDMLVSAKHYLDFEIKEPQIDAMVDVAAEEDVVEEPLKEGVWSLGSANEIKSAIQTLEMWYDLDARQISALFDDPDNENFFYNVVGDDIFHDYLNRVEKAAAIDDADRAHNAVGDAIGRAEELLVFVQKREGVKEGLPKGYWDKKMDAKDEVSEDYDALVNKIKKQGKSEKAAKAIAGAVASYKAKGGGKGPTAKQKARG